MPTIMRHEGVRYFFYSDEGEEPPHVHVERQGCTGKFWLAPIELARNHGFAAHELHRIERVISANRGFFQEVWREFFGS